MYVAIVIAARCNYFYHQHSVEAAHEKYGEPKVFKLDANTLNAFAICVFAYNCHINVVPVAGRLVRPTKERIRKVAWWVNGIQFAFYAVIGVTGYLTFLKKTPGDVIKGFKINDPFMVVARILLSITMLIGIPLNTHPTVRSGLQIWDYFFPEQRVLLLSPPGSPASSPRLGNEGMSPFRTQVSALNQGIASATSSQGTLRPTTMESSASEPALPRVVLGVSCLALQAGIAIVVPNVSDVLGLLGATVATAMIMIIPAFCAAKVLPNTLMNRCRQAVLIFFSLVSFSSVPVKILQMAKVID